VASPRIATRVALAMLLSWALTAGATEQPSAGCSIRQYQLIALPLEPAAINDAGQVAGTTSEHLAAVWTRDKGLHVLPLPSGFSHSEAVAINRRGHVLGIAQDATFAHHRPFLFANEVLTLLPGEQARAYQLNGSDAVVGESLLSGAQRSQPVLWSRNIARALGGCCGGSAQSINDVGQVVGNTYDQQGRYYAFLWTEASGLERIGPPNRFSSAIAVNNPGHVIVQAFSSVFFYVAGSLTRLSLSPKYPSHPRALNDCDIIVGSFGPFSDADRAFAWERTQGFLELNARIPADAGWKLKSATSINNRGEIVCKGAPPGEEDGGFLLIPVSAPPSN